jgi:hypothetical protein
MGKMIFSFTAIVVFALLFVGFLVRTFENRLIFYPFRYPAGDWRPEDSGLIVEDCRFAAEDGVDLHGWFAESLGWSGSRTAGGPLSAAESGAMRTAPLTLLWFHGNAGNITHRTENMMLLTDRGINVFIFDYRGYGRSGGDPSEAGIYKDGLAAYDYLVNTRGIPSQSIVLFGRSLGAAVAVEVGIMRPARGIILETPFTDAREMARVLLPVIPAGLFLRSQFDNIGKIGGIRAPLLIVHGDRDEIVPYRLGRKLFDAAREPKSFYTIPGSGHNDTYLVGGEAYFRALQNFWEGL